MRLTCPHCHKNDFDSDWMYNHNLFCPDEEFELECPDCFETFHVKTYECIGYESAKTKEEL